MRVKGLGFRDHGLGFRSQGLGFRVACGVPVFQCCFGLSQSLSEHLPSPGI